MTLHLDNHPHAVVKDGVVINILIFDDHDASLLDDVCQSFNADEVVCCCNHGVAYIDGPWDGTLFKSKQPFNSWIWNTEFNIWEAPVAVPLYTDKKYEWDESTLSWVEIAE
jgi:hypothetical protein